VYKQLITNYLPDSYTLHVCASNTITIPSLSPKTSAVKL